jgi:acyl carrier protein
MDEADVRTRVRSVIASMAPLRPVPVEADSELRTDLGYDSLSLVELAVALEEEFGLPATAEDDTDVEAVRDVEELVLERLAAAREQMGS